MSVAAEKQSSSVSEVATKAAEAPSVQAVPPKAAAGEGYRTVGDFTSTNPVMQARGVDVFYGDNRYCCGVILVVSLKARAKWNWLSLTDSAMPAKVRSCSKCSLMKSFARRRL